MLSKIWSSRHARALCLIIGFGAALADLSCKFRDEATLPSAVDPEASARSALRFSRSALGQLLIEEHRRVPETMEDFAALLPKTPRELRALLDQRSRVLDINVPFSDAPGYTDFADVRSVFALEPRDEQGGNLATINYAFKIFTGTIVHPDRTEFEFISWNRQLREYDFGIIEGLGSAETPRIVFPNAEEKCFTCHRNRGPIFPVVPWSNTNVNFATWRAFITYWAEHGGPELTGLKNELDAISTAFQRELDRKASIDVAKGNAERAQIDETLKTSVDEGERARLEQRKRELLAERAFKRRRNSLILSRVVVNCIEAGDCPLLGRYRLPNGADLIDLDSTGNARELTDAFTFDRTLREANSHLLPHQMIRALPMAEERHTFANLLVRYAVLASADQANKDEYAAFYPRSGGLQEVAIRLAGVLERSLAFLDRSPARFSNRIRDFNPVSGLSKERGAADLDAADNQFFGRYRNERYREEGEAWRFAARYNEERRELARQGKPLRPQEFNPVNDSAFISRDLDAAGLFFTIMQLGLVSGERPETLLRDPKQFIIVDDDIYQLFGFRSEVNPLRHAVEVQALLEEIKPVARAKRRPWPEVLHRALESAPFRRLTEQDVLPTREQILLGLSAALYAELGVDERGQYEASIAALQDDPRWLRELDQARPTHPCLPCHARADEEGKEGVGGYLGVEDPLAAEQYDESLAETRALVCDYLKDGVMPPRQAKAYRELFATWPREKLDALCPK